MSTTLEHAIRCRRSVRGFHRDKPVDHKVIEEVLKLAQHAPSNCNVQPWRLWVLSGDSRDKLSDQDIADIKAWLSN